MSRHWQHKRVDGNQPAVIEALAKSGWSVLSLSKLGRGAPDLLAWKASAGYRLIEVKQPKGKPTPAQVRFREAGWPVVTVRSADEVWGL